MMKCRKYFIEATIANACRSNVEYLDSVAVSFLEKYPTGFPSWNKAPPIPKPEASVYKLKGVAAKTGVKAVLFANFSFTLAKADCASECQ